MKKIILTSVLFITAMLFHVDAFAQCETNLTEQLQDCFTSQGFNLTVTVNGSYAEVSGNISASQVSAAQVCVDDYEAAATFCPGAPSLLFTLTITDDSTHPVAKGNNQ